MRLILPTLEEQIWINSVLIKQGVMGEK